MVQFNRKLKRLLARAGFRPSEINHWQEALNRRLQDVLAGSPIGDSSDSDGNNPFVAGFDAPAYWEHVVTDEVGAAAFEAAMALAADLVFAEAARLGRSGCETVIITRCAGHEGQHSAWAYGPIYWDTAAARADGHGHEVECCCGMVGGRPL